MPSPLAKACAELLAQLQEPASTPGQAARATELANELFESCTAQEDGPRAEAGLDDVMQTAASVLPPLADAMLRRLAAAEAAGDGKNSLEMHHASNLYGTLGNPFLIKVQQAVKQDLPLQHQAALRLRWGLQQLAEAVAAASGIATDVAEHIDSTAAETQRYCLLCCRHVAERAGLLTDGDVTKAEPLSTPELPAAFLAAHAACASLLHSLCASSGSSAVWGLRLPAAPLQPPPGAGPASPARYGASLLDEHSYQTHACLLPAVLAALWAMADRLWGTARGPGEEWVLDSEERTRFASSPEV
ncbi:hypothetical protein ABPG75_011132 [Micractinium tetrahymenae]